MAALYICLYTTVLSEWHVNFDFATGKKSLRPRTGMDSNLLSLCPDVWIRYLGR